MERAIKLKNIYRKDIPKWDFKPNVTTHKKSAGARLAGRAKIYLLRSYNPKNI